MLIVASAKKRTCYYAEIRIRYTTHYSRTVGTEIIKLPALISNQESEGASGIKKTADSGIIVTRSRRVYYNRVII